MTRRRLGTGSLVLALVIALLTLSIFGVPLRFRPTTPPATSAGTHITPPAAEGGTSKLRYAGLRGITFYDPQADAGSPKLLSELRADLPLMQAVGFNSVRLVPAWHVFEPEALPAAQYNGAAFANLRSVLAFLTDNHMKVVLGLNYLGQGWSPKGINPCTYATDPTQWHAFVQYVDTFLTNIQAFAPDVYLLAFDETALLCGVNEWVRAQEFARALQPTVGSLPRQLAQLNPSLRAAFKIGFQDNGLIMWGWSGVISPIAAPMSYDFLSMSFYDPQLPDGDGAPDEYDRQGCALSIIIECARHKLEKQAARFAALYPGVPLVFGEAGGTYCDTAGDAAEGTQARVEQAIAAATRQTGHGMAIWNWSPGRGRQVCGTNGHLDLAITHRDGNLNPAGQALQAYFHTPPVVARSGVSTAYQPWAVWVQGSNLAPTLVARLADNKGQVWGGDLSMAYDTTSASFQLPADKLPPWCGLNPTCQVVLTLFDPISGLSSTAVTLTLPSAQAADRRAA